MKSLMRHLAMRNRRAVSILLMLAGACLLGLGLWRGEGRIVLQKAVRICLECIGIG